MSTPAIYARKSTDDRGHEETRSTARQIADARAFAARIGLPPIPDCRVYVDEGISGAATTRLRARARLITDVESGWITAVIMADMSRFSRREGHEVVAELRQIAKRAAIYFYETGQRYVFGDIGANISNFVMAEANADYRRKIRVKTIHAMRAKAERGHVLGSAPFGYRNVDVVVGTDASGRPVRSHVTREIVEAQAAVVRDVFARYARGQGFKQIAVALNRAGVPTPRPRARKHDDGVVRLIRPASWGPSNVRSILLNPIYRGVARWNRLNQHDDEGAVPASVRPADEHVTHYDPAWRIVSDEIADAVEARFADAERKKFGPKPGPRTKYLLSGGLLICPTCGGRFEALNKKFYVCATRRHSGGSVCANPLALRIDVMDEAVIGLLEGQVLAPAFIEEVVALVAGASSDQARAALVTQRDGETAAIQRLVSVVAGLGDDLPELTAQLRARTAARDALDRQLAEMSAPVDTGALRAALEQRATTWRAGLRAHPDEARYVIEHLIGPVELWHGTAADLEIADGFDPNDRTGKEMLTAEDLGLKARVAPEGLLSGLGVRLSGCGGRI